MWSRFRTMSGTDAIPAYRSSQRNIQPPQRIHGDTIAGVDQHRRRLRLDDCGTVQGVPGPEIVERIDWHVTPAVEEGLPLATRRAGADRRCRPAILPALRDGTNRGDAGVDEHDLLAARGVGVEFLVLDVKTVLDLIDEIFRVPVQPIQRHVDFEDLFAVTHFAGALDGDRSIEPRPKPAHGLLLQFGK